MLAPPRRQNLIPPPGHANRSPRILPAGLLAPARRQSLIPPPGHANRSPRILPAGRPCWRLPPGKTLSYRLATPTGRPEDRLAAVHVGAGPPAKPYPTAWLRHRSPEIPPAVRPCWRLLPVKAISYRLATPTGRPEFRLAAVHVGAGPPAKPYPTAWLRHRSPEIPPAVRPCWRLLPVKAISYRLATPTGRPEFRLAAVHVGAGPPAKPYPTAWPRQQGT